MTEEEKKAIEYLENRLDILHNNTQWATEENIKVVLNLIEKQQKEVEELKNGQIDFWISDKEIEERIKNKFISKEKIREKIEELENLQENQYIHLDYTKKILKELLEEE